MLKRTLTLVLMLAGVMFCAAGQARAEQITAYASVNDVNTLLTFESAAPEVITSSRAIIGLRPNEALRGIDYRPATNQLFALTNQSRLYTIDPTTGVATFVSTLSTPLANPSRGFGVDFNPVVDRLRIVGADDQNLRVNVDTGATTTDGAINPSERTVSASAYSNNVAGATTTTLYGIDVSRPGGFLVIQNPPNGGTVVDVGSLGLGFDIDEFNGFDISGATGVAYAALNDNPEVSPNSNVLFSINLVTGLATRLGTINGGGLLVEGLTVTRVTNAAPVPEPATMMLLGTGLVGIAAKVRRRRKVAEGSDDEN